MNVLNSQQLAEIKKFDGPTICNALECFDALPRSAGFTMPIMFPRTLTGKRMIGYAATAKISARHPGERTAGETAMKYYQTVRDMADPTVSVVQDIDPQPIGSYWGEVQATTHSALGSIGTITHGGVRDIDEAEAMGFHFFSTELLISHAYVHVVDCNCSVEVAGLHVNPGDLLYADKHGVLIIPHSVADRLAEACRLIAEAEYPMLIPCREAIKTGVKPSIDQIKEWRGKLEEARRAVTKRFRP